MAILLILFKLILSQSEEFKIGLLTSEYTDPDFKAELLTNLDGLANSIESSLGLQFSIFIQYEQLDLSNFQGIWTLPIEFLKLDITIFLDSTNLPVFSQFLAGQAIQNNWLQIIIDRPINSILGELPSANTFFTYPNFTSEVIALHHIIIEHSWTNLGLIYDQQVNNMQMAKAFKAMVPSSYILDEMIIDADDVISYITLTNRLSSTTQNSGARIIFVFANPVLAALLLASADQVVMGSSGYAWIFNSNAMYQLGEVSQNSNADVPAESYGILKTGAIGLMTEDEAYLNEEPLGDVLAVISLLASGYQQTGSYAGLGAYLSQNNNLSSLKYQLHFDSTGLKTVNYYLYNLKNFASIQVAAWNAGTGQYMYDSTVSIVWPGLGTTPPNDNVPIVKVCLLYPKTNSDGSNNPKGEEVRRGFALAVSELNTNSAILGDYNIEVIYKDTLQSVALAAVTIKSLASLNILGYFGPDSNDLSMAYANATESYLDPKPIVSYQASDYLLSDSTVYPRFLRTVQPDGLQAVAIAMQINVLAWKNIAVLYSDDSTGQGIYVSFQNNMQTLEITILNDPGLSNIGVQLNEDGTLSQSTKDRVEVALSEVVRVQAKIIVYLGNTALTPEILKVAYEKQLYGQDYCWLGSMWVTDDVLGTIATNYAADMVNIYKVLNGAFGLAQRGIQGTVGTTFNQSYFNLYKTSYSVEAMLAYDTAYLVGYTLQSMVASGQDFNSGKEFTDALRAADFTGASGKIKFSEGTNDRSAYGYSVVNIQNGVIVEVEVYDPLNPSMFTATPGVSMIYADGTTNHPPDLWPTAYDCPFAQNMSNVSINGVAIVFCVGFALLVVTLLLSWFSYRKWREVRIEHITTKVTRNWKDTMVQIQIVIEFFQFIAIAPPFQSLEIVVTAASNIFMLDILKVTQSSKGDYWLLLSVICALCYSWSFLVVLIMANAENWLKRLPLCQKLLSVMNALYLPFYGNTMFLPSLALLLDVLVCDHQAQGHAYVWRDCYMNCWEGEHLSYLIMALLAIALYEPIAVFSRPLWQQAKTGLNIKIKPFFLLFKTCVQILLIAVGKSLISISPLSHGVVFSVIFIAFTVTTYKIQPFNYSRCNLWETTSLIAVSYMSVLATLSYAGNSTNIGWFITLIIGWAIMISVALFIQRKHMPNLLISPSDKDSKIQNYNAVKPLNVLDQSEDISEIREVGEIKVAKNDIEKAIRDSVKHDSVKVVSQLDENVHKISDNDENEDDDEEEEDDDADDEAQPIN